MFASIRYISTHHEAAAISGQPYHGPGGRGDLDDDELPRPDSPESFAAALKELSQDLVLKERQIEFLIRNLPGTERSPEEQDEHLKRVNSELEATDVELEVAQKQKQELLQTLEQTILRVSRYKH